MRLKFPLQEELEQYPFNIALITEDRIGFVAFRKWLREIQWNDTHLVVLSGEKNIHVSVYELDSIKDDVAYCTRVVYSSLPF